MAHVPALLRTIPSARMTLLSLRLPSVHSPSAVAALSSPASRGLAGCLVVSDLRGGCARAFGGGALGAPGGGARAVSAAANGKGGLGFAAGALVHVPKGARAIGGGVPPEFGQPKTGGTAFLGTPANHMELVHKRPLSPDIIPVDGKATPWLLHYKMPLAAISSITNRVSSVILSAAILGGGTIHAATGSLPAVASALGTFSVVAVPLKAGLAFPFVYHYLAALRHYYWDYTNGATVNNEGMFMTSAALFAASVAGTGVIVGM